MFPQYRYFYAPQGFNPFKNYIPICSQNVNLELKSFIIQDFLF